MDSEGDHKLTAIAVLTAIEFMSVKYAGDQEQSGLVMRELRKDGTPLLERFAVLMTEFEAKFRAVDAEGKMDLKHRTMIDSLFESWKKNGSSNQFDADVRDILFDKNAMPIYLDNRHDKAFLQGFVQGFK